MNHAAVILLISGCLVLAGATIAVWREGLKRHWFKGTFSFTFAITTPEQRLPKPPKTAALPAAEKTPAGSAVPVPIDGRRAAG